MKTKQFLTGLVLLFLLNACKTGKNIRTEVKELPEINVVATKSDPHLYRASFTKAHDLLHTALDVRFDWSRQYLYGKATISLQPHFYNSDHVWLNARGMELKRVALLRGKDTLELRYDYNNDSLKVYLDRWYNRTERFQLYIDYIAKPEELKNEGGSAAIRSDKGLYFINADGKEKNKPQQIWTQGETQASSAWFPTIDAPNQRMTQEIKITVDSVFKTLSNGILVESKNNNDGTRSDYWKQELPHAPYLVMMAIGKFSVLRDQWRGKEVSYYVEPAYEKVARKIFGNTPEMIEFFSKRLGVDYPWAKYSQVVVRDYVSGAMENTTATIHGDFLQQDERELLDGTNEDVVSHELFHQWFGDYVTCESWSNIPLNESFATYGEYLWNEYKYGRDEADIYRLADLNAYLREARSKKVDLIRFYYDKQEDMFDRHSYQKGGTILHMLRKITGDDAFFAALKLYLETNKYKTVEAHQLRLAFEEVTGQDMNWFFNDWFFAKGHPILDINYGYNEQSHVASVTIRQVQDLQESPLYRLPIAVDIYTGDEVIRQNITISKTEEKFYFTCTQKPGLINVDAEKMIPGVRNDHHAIEEWMTMYRKAPLFQDRMDALTALGKDYKANTPGSEIILEALKDKNPRIREVAIGNIEAWVKSDKKEEVKKLLMDIGRKDRKADVRDAAISALDTYYPGDELLPYFKNTVSDSSFTVMETSLSALAERDKTGTLALCKTLEGDDHEKIFNILTMLYAKYGDDSHYNYMKKSLDNSSGTGTYVRLKQFSKFMQRCSKEQNIRGGLKELYSYGKTETPWIVRLASVQSLAEFGNYCTDQSQVAAKAGDKISEETWLGYQQIAGKYVDELKKNESNENLLRIYNTQK